MDMQVIAAKVADAVAKAPAVAQELVSDPDGAVERIAGVAGADVTTLLPLVLERLAERGVDLSFVDLSKLDLSQVDVARLDVAQLQAAASRLNVDLSRLDVAAIAGKLLGGGASGLGGLLGGLLGRR